MKPRTAVVAALILLAFSSVAAVGLADSGPDLNERWTSDTSRDDRRNHHAVGVGGDVVVAPVTTVATTADVSQTACALVRLGTDGSVRWRQGVAPANCTAHALTQPAIADLDDDGNREVATSTTEQVVRVHDAAFGDEQWRVLLSTYGYSKPAVGNLTSDPGDEVVVSDIQGGVVAMSGETVRWRQTLSGFVWADPVVGDIDGDSTPEALVATSHNTTLLSATGGVEWDVPADAD